MMKTFLRIASWAVVVALGFMLPIVASRLPASTGEKIRGVDEGWAGVLRIWACPGFEPGNGSFMPWLNERFSRFEARHKGVYVQIINVSSNIMPMFASGDVNPPDAILFAPGMLASADALTPVMVAGLRADLSETGLFGGIAYAAPIAMGGYAWVYDASQLSVIPANFRSLPPIKQPVKSKDTSYYINCAADAPFVSWSSALLSLMADRYVEHSDSPGEMPRAGEGIDLGLPDLRPPPEGEIDERAERVACFLPDALPENFRADVSVYGDFTSGRAAAIPATQREIRRLQLLSDTGRAPDFRVESVGDNFTDQLLMYAIVDYPRDDIEKRQALCAELLGFLLTEDSQVALQKVRAFSVIDIAPLYAGQFGMAQLEAAMMREVLAPNAFDGDFRRRAKERADRFVREQMNLNVRQNE